MAEKLSNTEIVKFMNYTTTYGTDKITDEITNYLSGFSTASQSIKNMEKLSTLQLLQIYLKPLPKTN